MLRNRFRKLIGLLILALFGLAVIRFVWQIGSSPYIGRALTAGLSLVLVLGLVLLLFFVVDRRVNRRQP